MDDRRLERIDRRQFLKVALSGGTAVFVVACLPEGPSTAAPSGATPQTERTPEDKKLTVLVGEFGTERMDAILAGPLAAGNNYARLVHGYLMSNDESGAMVPGIASEASLSSDGLTWTFTIRNGVKWHDGSDLSAQDVLWTLEHSVGPEASAWNTKLSQAAAVSKNVGRVSLIAPNQVSVTTKVPNPTLATLFSEASPVAISVLPKRTTLHNEQEESAYDLKPIGAGPLKLVGRVRGSSMSFERFDDFYYQPKNGFAEDRRVRFQSLDLNVVPEESSRVAAIRSGQADIAAVSLESRSQIEAGGGHLVFAEEAATLEARFLGSWETKYPIHDKRVRQALDYAINKELIRDSLAGGADAFRVKGWTLVTPSSIGYTTGLDPRPFDPERARQMLADAGFPGGNGFGKVIINTYPSAEVPFQVDAAQLTADVWKRELGLDTEVRVGDSVGTEAKFRSGELNGQLLWRQNKPRLDATSPISTIYGNPTSPVRLHEDPELRSEVRRVIGIVNPDAQADALRKLYLRLFDESHWLSIGYVNLPWAVGPRVAKWQPYPLTAWPSALHTIEVN